MKTFQVTDSFNGADMGRYTCDTAERAAQLSYAEFGVHPDDLTVREVKA